MKSGSSLDLYDFDSLLNDEQRAIQSTIREFVNEKVLPVISDHYLAGTFPADLIKAMAGLGIYGANLPERYGCSGLDNISYGLVMYELERGDSGLRSFASVQGSLVMYPIFTYGSDEQKDKYLPRLASGELLGCFGLTEPDAGSDPSSMKMRAVKDGTGWILNGTKMWITNGNIADIAIIWAKSDDGYLGFIVDTRSKGFTANEVKGKLSLRASITSELVLEDVKVGDSQRLPKASGLRAPLSCLDQARYGIAWGAAGAASFCYEEALSYAKKRIMFGVPIAGFQLVQEKLVYMIQEITKAQLLVLRLGQLKDEGRVRPAQVSLAKLNCVYMARECARLAREILGANGILAEYHSMRHLANLESVLTYEGTHDIHKLVVGEEITGISAFRRE
jgi:glutaryl-CoA dehydrogenase